jgi:hypothetical protein
LLLVIVPPLHSARRMSTLQRRQCADLHRSCKRPWTALQRAHGPHGIMLTFCCFFKIANGKHPSCSQRDASVAVKRRCKLANGKQ